MRDHVVTWHNTSLNPASRTLILINHPVRSLDTPEEGILSDLWPPNSPGCRLFPYRFLHLRQQGWRSLREKIIKRGRITWTFGKWPRYVQQGAVTADRNTWTVRRWRGIGVEGKEMKERGRERSLEGLMISRESSHRIRDEINVATYEMRAWRISFDSFVERNGISGQVSLASRFCRVRW